MTVKSRELLRRIQLIIAIIAGWQVISGPQAKAESMYVIASNVHIGAYQRNYVMFRCSIPNGLTNVTYQVHTGLPVYSESKGHAYDWPLSRVSATQLELAVPADFCKKLSRLKTQNSTLAKTYCSPDTWVLEVDYASPDSNPQLAPKSHSTWFNTLSGWLKYITAADQVSSLIDKYGSQMLGLVSNWASDIADAIGSLLGSGWEWLLALLGA